MASVAFHPPCAEAARIALPSYQHVGWPTAPVRRRRLKRPVLAPALPCGGVWPLGDPVRSTSSSAVSVVQNVAMPWAPSLGGLAQRSSDHARSTPLSSALISKS